MLDVARLLGLHDCGVASSSEQLLLRLLLPILKLYTAKQAVATTSEGLESFGGQGYMEDTGLPTFLRDAQVHGSYYHIIISLIFRLSPCFKFYCVAFIVALCLARSCIASISKPGYGASSMSTIFVNYVFITLQVLPIWEGTTNILSLDVLRVLQKSGAEVISLFFFVPILV